mmetsp:Transcript_14075/g.35372  ORF Transcript_14075/g.35372 Transcript_14075/m.35372 type:complete len:307 (+) Transcript_14075:387-1307(+)
MSSSVPAKEDENGNGGVEIEDMSKARQRLCEECNEKPSLYQCPGCSIRTCSLHCCQAHKKRTKCTGKRSRGAYLPLCHMSDSTLRSDYFFMEEILGVMPRARKVSKLAEDGKTTANDCTRDNASQKNRSVASINKKAKRLVQQALRRGITLQVMPPVMERHRNNSSWYCSSRDLITWKVEVILVPKMKTFSFKLSEQEEGILGHISKYIADTYADDSEMPSTISPDDHQLLIKRLPSSASNPRYIQIKNNESLKTVLDGLTIVEYPTIYCVNDESMKDYPLGTSVITEEASMSSASKDSHPKEASI